MAAMQLMWTCGLIPILLPNSRFPWIFSQVLIYRPTGGCGCGLVEYGPDQCAARARGVITTRMRSALTTGPHLLLVASDDSKSRCDMKDANFFLLSVLSKTIHEINLYSLFDVFSLAAKIEGAVDISTTDCTMCFLGTGITKRGSLSYDTAKIGCDEWNITACTFVFENYVHFTNKATVNIKGEHALRIVSKKGDIEISTKFDLSMKGKIPNVNSKTFLGGYHNYNGSNPGMVTLVTTYCHNL